MLTHLTIKNYTLIRHFEMKPSDRLTVITGETGAGKSIMLGAIGLLLGNRADTKVLWDESEKCVAEGVFDIKPYKLKSLFEELDLDYHDQSLLRREISPGGKSRAFINDTPVTLDVMRVIGARLMDVHSQHETLELGTHRFQLALIDSYAGNTTLLASYQQEWKKYIDASDGYNKLKEASGKLKAEYDFIKFQLDELQKAGLRSGEQEALESGLKIAEHGEDIKTRLNQLLATLGQADRSVQNILSESVHLLQPVRSYTTAYDQIASRLDSLRIELKDIISEIEREEEAIAFDPEKTKELQARIDTIYSLMQKHRTKDIDALLAIQEQLEQQVTQTVNLDADLESAGKKMENSRKQILSLAGELGDAREKSMTPLSKQMIKLLRDLGIPDANIAIQSKKTEPGPFGADQVEIRFSANKGIAPRALEDVASGGEFSRVMFAIKYIMAEKTALPTLVLDEIDTGVSGEIAIQLGKMMKAMSQRHQLITISHLPQIAAKGDEHFLVYKETFGKKTVSVIKSLKKEERVDEIAKMIGGLKPSEIARENARELMG